MTHLLSSLANGRVIVALEGGYNLTAIAYSMTMCTKALLGDPIPPLQLNDEIHPVAVDSIRDVLRVQSEYWSVLKPFRKHFPFNENQVVFGVYPEKPSVENLDSCFEKLTIQEKSKQSRSEFDLNLNPIEMEREANENADATAAGPAASSSKEEVNVQPINLTVTTTGATEDDANPLNEALQIMGECANEVQLTSNYNDLQKFFQFLINMFISVFFRRSQGLWSLLRRIALTWLILARYRLKESTSMRSALIARTREKIGSV